MIFADYTGSGFPFCDMMDLIKDCLPPNSDEVERSRDCPGVCFFSPSSPALPGYLITKNHVHASHAGVNAIVPFQK
jgi:hypothetical protein